MTEPQPPREPLAQTRTRATETGRVNQKLRTRRALVDAAKELIAAGGRPTLAEVADHARVSKTTAYRYFASADDLIAEAFFDSDFPTVAEVLDGATNDPAERVLAVGQAVNGVLLSHERAMRVIVRNAIEKSLDDTGDGAMRFGRRRSLIDGALEPLEGRLGRDELDRLRDALALVIGPEAVLAARDVCGLDPDATHEVTGWAAQALVAQALADAEAAPRTTA